MSGTRLILRGFSALALMIALSITAHAQTGRAFIVGVGEYEELTDLDKAVGDAAGYEQLFRDTLSYEVTTLTNPDRRAFLTAFGSFLDTIQPGDPVVFIFSGHGWSDRAENFLVMADAPLQASETLMKAETIPVSTTILADIQARKPGLTFAIIDACRNYPFDSLTRNAFGRGLARTPVTEGTFLMFSAGAGQEALDRLSDEDPAQFSVFTRVFLPNLSDADRPLTDIARETKSEVRRIASSIGHRQNPAYADELFETVCLSGRCAVDATASGDAERDAFINATLDTAPGETCAQLADYVDTYPAGRFEMQARALRTGLNCPRIEGDPAAPDVTAITAAPFKQLRTSGDGGFSEFRAVAPSEEGSAWYFGSKDGETGRNFLAFRLYENGAEGLEIEWETERTAWGYAAAPASDGGVWVGGAVDMPELGTKINERGYFARLDRDGNVLFSMTLSDQNWGFDGWSRIYDIAPAPDGGAWLVGFTSFSADDLSILPLVVRVGPDGEFKFWKGYHNTYGEQAFSVSAKPGGGAYVGGATRFLFDDTGVDAWMMEIDEDGEWNWEQHSKFPGYDIALGIDARDDGGFYLAGYTEYAEDEANPNDTTREGFVVAIGPNRELDWSRTVGDGATGLRAVVSLPNGAGAWFGGYTTLTNDLDRGYGSDDGAPNGYLLRLDGNGRILAQHVVGGSGSDDIIDIAGDSNAMIWVAGSLYNSSTGQPNSAAGRLRAQ